MKEVQLEKLKAQIPEREFDILHAVDPWFCLSHKAGYAKGLWNFTVALMDAECENLELAYKVAADSTDLIHLCGFHKLRFSQNKWEQMRWFFTRVWHNKAILHLKPGLKDYIEFICENSKVPNGRFTRPLGLFKINNDGDGALQRLPWRTKEWYGRHRPSRPAHITAPFSEFWPYVTRAVQDEHNLLIAVDNIIPRSLHEQTRADICQDVIVSILSGEVSLENLSDTWPVYLKRTFKQYPSKYGHVSLDIPVFDGSKTTLAEVLI